MGETILNIAGGKIAPLDLHHDKNYFVVNIDTMYYQHSDPGDVEQEIIDWRGYESRQHNINEDAFIYMERTALTFDRVCAYRFLEHVPMDKVLYFIYLLSTVTKSGAQIDIIVPNYAILAQMILAEANCVADTFNEKFEAHNIELTTELLNEPSCPHASIWTDIRADYFFTLEGRFKIIDVCNHFDFDGRNIYLRFWAERL